MATIKSYTDLDQSKKLAEILPLESADMYFNIAPDEGYSIEVIQDSGFIYHQFENTEDFNDCQYLPCWSLAALLDVLESEIDGEEGETYQLNIEKDGTWWNIWYMEQYDEANPIETESTEDLVDACVEMILKLHELKML